MNKTCDICHKDGIYKCPTCLIFYCSLTCCKKHREAKCDVVKFDSDEDEEEQVERKRKKDNNYHDSELEVPKNNEQGNGLLGNNHSRNLPVTIDEAENVEEILEKNEQEPIFEEIAGACLKVVEPQIEDDEPQITEDTL
ncbi:zinc finger HIT domain-containing protein 3 [Anoplophora glabripennis]|nr:zinc finger HIT domain-containing protein 3 [Anoplophora glabripennis]